MRPSTRRPMAIRKESQTGPVEDAESGRRKPTRAANEAGRIADRDTGLRPSPKTLRKPRQKGTRSALLRNLARGDAGGDSGRSGHRGTTRTSDADRKRSDEREESSEETRGFFQFCRSLSTSRAITAGSPTAGRQPASGAAREPSGRRSRRRRRRRLWRRRRRRGSAARCLRGARPARPRARARCSSRG